MKEKARNSAKEKDSNSETELNVKTRELMKRVEALHQEVDDVHHAAIATRKRAEKLRAKAATARKKANSRQALEL